MALRPDHPVVVWARHELVPLLVERLAARRVVVFDPPDRTAALGERPPGLLVVSARFRGMPVPERNALLTALLTATVPVRPLCFTPEEFATIDRVPGTVLAAARAGVRLL